MEKSYRTDRRHRYEAVKMTARKHGCAAVKIGT